MRWTLTGGTSTQMHKSYILCERTRNDIFYLFPEQVIGEQYSSTSSFTSRIIRRFGKVISLRAESHLHLFQASYKDPS